MTPPASRPTHEVPEFEVHRLSRDCGCCPVLDPETNCYRHRTMGERLGLGRWTLADAFVVALAIVAVLFMFGLFGKAMML